MTNTPTDSTPSSPPFRLERPHRRRAHPALRLAFVFMFVLAVYLVGRAIAEPFVIDVHDPSTYRHDWGGPHLAGVLAIHCGPGVVSLFWLRSLWRRHRPRRRTTARRGSR